MKAVLMTREGEPEVLEYRDVPEPEIRSLTQIKVRLHRFIPVSRDGITPTPQKKVRS